MAYYMRYMCKEDVPQVNTIDREAFPTQWPPPDYRRELQNPLARLLVACDDSPENDAPETQIPQPEVPGLASRIKRWWRQNRPFGNEPPPSGRLCIVGFTSIWVMADEAHITNIAVRQSHQRQGIGEMLLMSIIDLAAELEASIVTLEVRVSNLTAQKLYHKYGFAQVGLRRNYYTDNREDALLMSTDTITSPQFQEHFKQLKRDHAQKYGDAMKSPTGSMPG